MSLINILGEKNILNRKWINLEFISTILSAGVQWKYLKCLQNEIFDFQFFGCPKAFWGGENRKLVYF